MASTFTPRNRRASFLTGDTGGSSFTPIIRPTAPPRFAPTTGAVDDLLALDTGGSSYTPIVRRPKVAPVAPVAPPAEADGRTAMDIWGRFARGGIGFHSALGSLAGADNPYSQFLDEQSNYYDTIISPAERARRDAQAEEVRALGPDAGFIDRLLLKGKQLVADPVGIGAETIGNVAGSLSVAPLLGVAGLSATEGAMLSEGLSSAGAVKQNIFQTIIGAEDKDLMQDKEYADLRAAGKGEPEAKAIIASKRQSYKEAYPEILGAGLISAGLAKFGADPDLLRAAGVGGKDLVREELMEAAKGATLKGAFHGFAKEALQEGAQEGMEQLAGNVGAAAGGANIDLTAGVPESIAAAGIMGGLSGPGMTYAGGIDARQRLAALGPEVSGSNDVNTLPPPSDFARTNAEGAAEQAALDASRKQRLLENRTYAPLMQEALGSEIQRNAEDQAYAPLLQRAERERSAIDDLLSRPSPPGESVESVIRGQEARSEAQRNLEDQAYRPLLQRDEATHAAAQTEAQGGLEDQYYRELLARPEGAARIVDDFHKAGMSWSQAIKAKDRLKEELLQNDSLAPPVKELDVEKLRDMRRNPDGSKLQAETLRQAAEVVGGESALDALLNANRGDQATAPAEGVNGVASPGLGEVAPAVVAGPISGLAPEGAELPQGAGLSSGPVAEGAQGESGAGLARPENQPQAEEQGQEGQEQAQGGQNHGGIVAPGAPEPWQMTQGEHRKARSLEELSSEIERAAGTSDPQEIADFYTKKYGLPRIRVNVLKSGDIRKAGTSRVTWQGKTKHWNVTIPGEVRGRTAEILRHEIEHIIDSEKHGHHEELAINEAGESTFSKYDHANFTHDYRHRSAVKRALKEGRAVPAAVLAAYPDLAASAPVARGPGAVASRTVAQRIKTAERQIASTVDQIRKAPKDRSGPAVAYRESLAKKLAAHQADLDTAQRHQVAIEALHALPKEDTEWAQTLADSLAATKVRGVGNKETNVELRSAIGQNGLDPSAFLAAHEAVKSGRATPETVEKYVQMVHLAQAAEIDIQGRTLTKDNPTGVGEKVFDEEKIQDAIRNPESKLAAETLRQAAAAGHAGASEAIAPRADPEARRLRRLAEEVSVQMRSPKDLRASLDRMSDEDVEAIRARFTDPRAIAAIEERLEPQGRRRSEMGKLTPKQALVKALSEKPESAGAFDPAYIEDTAKVIRNAWDAAVQAGAQPVVSQQRLTKGLQILHHDGTWLLRSALAMAKIDQSGQVNLITPEGTQFTPESSRVVAGVWKLMMDGKIPNIHINPLSLDSMQIVAGRLRKLGVTWDTIDGAAVTMEDVFRILRGDEGPTSRRTPGEGAGPSDRGQRPDGGPRDDGGSPRPDDRDGGGAERAPEPEADERRGGSGVPADLGEAEPAADSGEQAEGVSPNRSTPEGEGGGTAALPAPIARPSTETVPVKRPTQASLTKEPGLFVQIGNRRYEVKDYADASKRWEGFRDATMRAGAMGAGLPRPVIVDQDGNEVARIAQNGKIFPPAADWRAEVGQTPLYDPSAGAAVDVAAAQTEKNPSEAQIEAGNYRKAKTRISGLEISIENEAGSRRRPEWPKLTAHYGYFLGSVGKDKEHVDVFVKPGTPEDFNGPVFVVNQYVNGKFDEHKVMLGYADEKAARRGYLANYSKGWKGLDSMAYFPDVDQFRDWLIDGDQQKEAPVVDAQDQAEFESPYQVGDWAKFTMPGIENGAGVNRTVSARVSAITPKGLEMRVPNVGIVTKQVSEVSAARPEPAPVEKPEAPKPDKFANNTVFTSEAIRKARARVAAKLKGNTNAGIDPELMVDMATIAGGHIEAGARSFVAYTKAMIEDLGEQVRPYLRGLYENIRHYPGFNNEGMTAAAEIESAPKTSEVPVETPAQQIERLAEAVADKLEGDGIKDNPALRTLANEAFMGTRASGAWSPRDAYDALEMGVSRYIQRHHKMLMAGKPETVLGRLREILQRLPTQADRTREQVELQQFSTPPTLAYVATRALKIRPGETVLEPSAGTGSLATMASVAGADVVTNEIAPRRAEILKGLGFDKTTSVDAEHLNALLPADIKPDAVLMNPPFSATGGRVANNQTKFGARHVEQALARMKSGGRLVAIVGQGMALDRPTFAEWWKRIASKYDVRANLGIPGEEYGKYGTTFGNQLLVIDKVPGKGLAATRFGAVPSLEEALNVIETLDRPLVGRGDQALGSPGEEPGASKAPDVGGGRAGGSRAPRNPSRGPRGSKPGGKVQGLLETERPGSEDGEAAGSPQDVREPVRDVDGGDARGSRPDLVFKPKNVGTPPARSAVGTGFTEAIPQRLDTTGMAKHPGSIVEPDSLASVVPPKMTYQPHLGDVLAAGGISDLQAEPVIYAGQQHARTLPTGQRAGYLLGDGTGVGKGRTLAAIALDNFRQGRKRILWVSVKWPLADQAKEDLTNIGASNIEVQRLDDNDGASPVEGDGVLFTTYDTFKQPKRYEQIKNWLGEEPVILFDEAHQAKNLVSDLGKPTAVGLAVQKVQDETPQARVVYASATSATEPKDMAYMNRLGLWGLGTAFPKFTDFRYALEAGGVGAMEMASRDMKALGLAAARALSMKDVQFQKTEHKLDADQVKMYDASAEIWQKILEGVDEAIEQTGGGTLARTRATSQFYSTMQRFFKQLASSYKVPTLIKRIEEELAADRSVVVRFVSTAQGAVAGEVAKAQAEGRDLEDLDLTPRDSIANYLEKSFPVALYEEVTDPDTGTTSLKPVLDAEGKPAVDPEAVRIRDGLLRQLSQITLPETALDQLTKYFGAKNVAEVTGRTKQLVVDELSGKRKYTSRAPKSANPAERDAFAAGKKRIMLMNDAGGTGMNAHASRDIKNQQQRVYFIYETGWSADKEMQGLGRVNRTNQASSPIYDLLHTNLPGERRFMSTIARRLGQLGALSRGERSSMQAGGLSDYDFENDYGKAAVGATYRELDDDIILKMGFRGSDGRPRLTPDDYLDVPKFLNRVLALQVHLQDQAFSIFEKNLASAIEAAKKNGQFDEGVSDVKAETITMVGKPTLVHTDEASGAETSHTELEAKVKTHPISWAAIEKTSSDYGQVDYYTNKQSGRVFGVQKVYGYDRTNPKTGKVERYYPGARPNGRSESIPSSALQPYGEESRYTEISYRDAEDIWKKEFADAPKFTLERLHYITGATLPIWDKLKEAAKYSGRLKVERATTDDGQRVIGVRIEKEAVPEVLRALNIKTKAVDSMDVFRSVLENGQTVQLDKGLSLARVNVNREPRLEVKGVDSRVGEMLAETFGLQEERIDYKYRYFIPTDEKAAKPILDKFLKAYGVIESEKGAKFATAPRGWTTVDTGPGYEPITLETVKKAIPGLRWTQGVNVEGHRGVGLRWDAGAFSAKLADGRVLVVSQTAERFLEVRNPAAFEASRRAGGMGENAGAVGSYTPFGLSKDALIKVSAAAPGGALEHEGLHFLWDVALRPDEKAALLKKYGGEEESAYAFAKWLTAENRRPSTFFQKVLDWVKRLVHYFRPTWETTFNEAASGRAAQRVGESTGRGGDGTKFATFTPAKKAEAEEEPEAPRPPRKPATRSLPPGPGRPVPIAPMDVDSLASRVIAASERTGTPDNTPIEDLAPPEFHRNMKRVLQVLEPEEAKAFARTYSEFDKEMTDARRKLSWETGDKEALKLMSVYTPEQFREVAQRGVVFNEPGLRAATRFMYEALAKKEEALTALKTAREDGGGGPQSDEYRDFVAAALDSTRWMLALRGEQAEAARAFNARKNLMGGRTDSEKLLGRLFKEIGGLTEKQATEVVAIAESNPEKLPDLVRRMFKPSFWDYINEYRKASMLSSVRTYGVNFFGNALKQAMTLAEIPVAAGVDAARSLVTGDERQVYAGEVAASRAALAKYGPDLFKRFLRDSKNALKGVERYDPEDSRPYEMQVGVIPGRAGKAIRTIFRLMSTADDFFKGIAEDRSLYRQAYRRARNEGLTGENAAKRTDELIAIGEGSDWADHRVAGMKERARRAAQYETFTLPANWENSGAFGLMATLASQAEKRFKPIGLFVPFKGTPANIAYQSFERSPLGLKAAWNRFAELDQIRKRLEASTSPVEKKALTRELNLKAEEAANQLARAMMGTAVFSIAVAAALAGNLTGSGPADPDKRRVWQKAGHIPTAVKVGDSDWYAYDRFEPAAASVALAANMPQVFSEQGVQDKVGAFVNAMQDAWVSKTYLQGLEQLADVMTDPTRYSQKWLRDLTGSFVPAFVGQTAETVDPTVRDATGGLADPLRARIPGLSDALPATRTGTGEPADRTGRLGGSNPLNPFAFIRTGKSSGDPLYKEFEQAGYAPDPHAKHLMVGVGPTGQKVQHRVDLTPQELELFRKADEMVTTRLRELIKRPEWRDLDPTIKKQEFSKLYSRGSNRVRAAILPRVAARLRAQLSEGADAR